MKISKYLLILSAAVVLHIAMGCSDDNGTGPDNDEDKIVGTWNLVSLVATVSGVNIDVTELDECLLETVLTFESDGDFNSSYAVDSDGECTTETASGTWEFEGDNTYTIQAEGLEVGSGTQELTFSDNNNTFSFSESDIYEGFEGEATITFERQ